MPMSESLALIFIIAKKKKELIYIWGGKNKNTRNLWIGVDDFKTNLLPQGKKKDFNVLHI
jgi:hypothetical protein